MSKRSQNSSYWNMARRLIEKGLSNAHLAVLSFVIAALCPVNMVNAQSAIEISPTTVIITKEKPIATVTIRNNSAEHIFYQARIYNWTQINGEDHYDTAEKCELISCPALFRLDSGESQIVRVGFEAPNPDWNEEHAYRLFIEEVPQAVSDANGTIKIALRLILPVFQQAETQSQPMMIWNVDQHDDGSLWMTARNDGTSHVLIKNVQLHNSNTFHFETGTHKYVLPHSTVTWALGRTDNLLAPCTEDTTLTVTTDQGVYSETLSTKP